MVSLARCSCPLTYRYCADNVSHEWTVKVLEHRVADRRIIRLIPKWLMAGVSEDGHWSETKEGYAPGGSDDAPYTKGNFQFERIITGWRTRYALLDLRLKKYLYGK